MAPRLIRPLNLVGLGLRLGHVTREAETVLAQCEHVYFLHGDPDIARFLSERCPSQTDLAECYRVGTSRLETYYGIASRVILHASRSPPIAVALYGHPTVLSTLSTMLIVGGRRFGVDMAIYPGISATDVILSDLGLDPGKVALQIHEATELLVFARRLDPYSGLLIFQVGQLETRLHTTGPSSPERLVQLAERLAITYGRSHELIAVEIHASGTKSIWRGALADLASVAPTLGAMTTIYVPPVSAPPIRDPKVLHALDDVTRLDRLVQ